MKQYSFLIEKFNYEDPVQKTVFSRRGQGKILSVILTKCPDAKTFKLNMLKKNPNNELGLECDENWDRQQYVQFLKNRVVKYNSTVKYVLSILIGQASVAALLFGIQHYTTGKRFRQSYEDAVNASMETQDKVQKMVNSGASVGEIDNVLNSPELSRKAIRLKNAYELNQKAKNRNVLRSLIYGAGLGHFKVRDWMDKLDPDKIK